MFSFSEVIGKASEGTFKTLSERRNTEKKLLLLQIGMLAGLCQWNVTSSSVFLVVMEKGLVVPV